MNRRNDHDAVLGSIEYLSKDLLTHFLSRGIPIQAARAARPPATTAEIQAALASLQSLLDRDFLAPCSNIDALYTS